MSTNPLQNRPLSLNAVKFPSYGDRCRVQVETTKNDVPCTVWVENKKTKNQWTCCVKDTKDHAPKSATYVLPSAAVISTLLEALGAVNTSATAATPATPAPAVPAKTAPAVPAKTAPTTKPEYAVDLKEGSKGHAVMVLTMKAFGKLSAEYEFDLTPKEVAITDKLEAKIRDLQDEVAALKDTSGPAQLRTELNELRQNLRNQGYYYGQYH